MRRIRGLETDTRKVLGVALIASVLFSPAMAYDERMQAYGDYRDIRDCTAMTAAAAIISAREFGQDSPRFNRFWEAAQGGEAALFQLIEAGIVAPTGDRITKSILEAGWEQRIERNIAVLEEDTDLGDEAWSYAHGCADHLIR